MMPLSIASLILSEKSGGAILRPELCPKSSILHRHFARIRLPLHAGSAPGPARFNQFVDLLRRSILERRHQAKLGQGGGKLMTRVLDRDLFHVSQSWHLSPIILRQLAAAPQAFHRTEIVLLIDAVYPVLAVRVALRLEPTYRADHHGDIGWGTSELI